MPGKWFDEMLQMLRLAFFASLVSPVAFAADGTLHGTVLDPDGIAVSSAPVDLVSQDRRTKYQTKASATGEYRFSAPPGAYTVRAQVPGFSSYESPLVRVVSGADETVDVHLSPVAAGKEMVLEVHAKKKRLGGSRAQSYTQVTRKAIEDLPQGNQTSLPKLLSTTTPGVVQGAFGQLFIRGNHANVQYQVDGVQLPESPSSTFSDIFSPRNLEQVEVITGGLPAEFGENLAAVVRMTSKSGPETPSGNAEVNYGSYNTFSPSADFGGSSPAGNLHYFLSANYRRTDRGIDTPQPESLANQNRGSTDVFHDESHGHNELVKLDWVADNENKISLLGSYSYAFYQIPVFPTSYDSNLASPVPHNRSSASDNQSEQAAYLQAAWRHTFGPRAFLLVAPFYKYSYLSYQGDPSNDYPSTFSLSRPVNHYGIRADYTWQPVDEHRFKFGVLGQGSSSTGWLTVSAVDPSSGLTKSGQDNSPNSGYFEAVYAQDDYRPFKRLLISGGIRFDATEFNLGPGVNPTDWALQPRIGAQYQLFDDTKVHGFYGRLYQPAPIENLRVTFSNLGAGALQPYDIKAEKDDYFEVGVVQALPLEQSLSLTAYYKTATNMLDDAQLLNTSIAQPFNFATGYAYGLEAGVRGKLSAEWSDYANYSYGVAKGRGISGGIFAFPPGQGPSGDYQFLDHVQLHTLNSGVTYRRGGFWWTIQLLFGSGLRTGPGNSLSLPAHLTGDTSVGYELTGQSWWQRFKISTDVLNVWNSPYPITIANGFNGSHYAAGRQIFVHLIKAL